MRVVATRRRVHDGRAFATLYALALLAIIAAALTATGAGLARDSSRTRSLLVETQQRALLRTGADLARAGKLPPGPIPLPPALAGYTLTASLSGSTVTLTATFGKRSIHQTIELAGEGTVGPVRLGP